MQWSKGLQVCEYLMPNRKIVFDLHFEHLLSVYQLYVLPPEVMTDTSYDPVIGTLNII